MTYVENQRRGGQRNSVTRPCQSCHSRHSARPDAQNRLGHGEHRAGEADGVRRRRARHLARVVPVDGVRTAQASAARSSQDQQRWERCQPPGETA